LYLLEQSDGIDPDKRAWEHVSGSMYNEHIASEFSVIQYEYVPGVCLQ
jgi:hypothetical protein